MKYTLLIYQAKGYNPLALSRDEHQAVAAKYAAVSSTANVRPGLPLGLPADAITLRSVEGELITAPGPSHPDATLGGYLEFEAETDDEAICLASQIPAVAQGGVIEIRPARVYW